VTTYLLGDAAGDDGEYSFGDDGEYSFGDDGE
jgi:hypothetical protein